MNRIPVAGPSITQREIDYVSDAVATCWHSEANKYNAKFEQAFAEYIGVKYAVTLPSCTSAIHLSLAAMHIGPEDEVIVPDITWIASAAPISYVGAKVVFADIDPDTWCLSPESFESCITEKTRAVIPVNLYGNMPKMDAILEIANRYNLSVIEDAAEAFGSEFNGCRAGSFGDTGVFSFHGSKTMTTGEGGMLVTDRDDLYERVSILRDHGRRPGDVSFFNSEVGFKYKMSSMQAAVGLAQVERAEELVARKRQIYSWYQEELGEIEQIQLNPEPPNVRNSFWMTTALFDPTLGLTKQDWGELLKNHGIDTRPFFHPLSSLPAYSISLEAQQAKKRNAIAYRISETGINLPSGLGLTHRQTLKVSKAIIQIVDQCKTIRKSARAA